MAALLVPIQDGMAEAQTDDGRQIADCYGCYITDSGWNGEAARDYADLISTTTSHDIDDERYQRHVHASWDHVATALGALSGAESGIPIWSSEDAVRMLAGEVQSRQNSSSHSVSIFSKLSRVLNSLLRDD